MSSIDDTCALPPDPDACVVGSSVDGGAMTFGDDDSALLGVTGFPGFGAVLSEYAFALLKSLVPNCNP